MDDSRCDTVFDPAFDFPLPLRVSLPDKPGMLGSIIWIKMCSERSDVRASMRWLMG
jgi:hypothetical protein